MEIIVLNITSRIDQQEMVFHPVVIKHKENSYLVDCGYAETFGELKTALADNNIRIQDLTAVLLTHDDIDHVAGLSLLKQENPTLKVYCSIPEKDAIEGLVPSERLVQAETTLACLPKDHQEWAKGFIERLKNISHEKVDHTFADLAYFDEVIQVIYTPGHTKGHISLFIPGTGVLIAGDALVIVDQAFEIANPAYTLDLPQALQSIIRIRDLAPTKIICYHGGSMENQIQEKLAALLSKYKISADA